MQIKKEIYDRMLNCPAVPPETGGIIGHKKNVICEFKFDKGTPVYSKGIYTPDVDMLNAQISEWMSKGITFCGIAHSHPADQDELSPEDVRTAKLILDALPTHITELFFPIILPGTKIIPYKAIRSGNTIVISNDTVKIII